MKKHIYILLVFFALTYFKTAAQSSRFVPIVGSASSQTKASANDSLSFFYKCVYVGTLDSPTFNGIIYTYFATSKNPSAAIANDSYNTAVQIPPDTIRNGDTINMYCHIPVNSSYFSDGKSNLIVIWPTGARQSNKVMVETNDSIHYPVAISVSGLSGIDEKSGLFGSLKIYPNPANTVLNIQNDNPALVLSSARVMDFNGKELIREQDDLSKIDVSALKPGTYLLELNSSDGNKTVYTFIISR